MHVAAQAVQLCHSQIAPLTTRLTECSGKLRAPVESITALAGLHLDEHAEYPAS